MRRIVGALAALSIIAAACGGQAGPTGGTGGGSGGGAAEANTVAIGTFVFEPRLLTVKAGTTVSWRNDHTLPHTVTSGIPGSKDGKFHGELAEKTGTFQHTFTEAGLYEYFCSIHPGMTGTVDVE